jgi:hypothetical protein
MDLATLAQLGEFIGGLFVVVSIVYLAHQVRQNTLSLRTENYARALDRLSTLQSKLSSDAELNRIVVIGAQTPDALTRSERMRFTWSLYELLGAAEFVFHQARLGALPDEVWDRWRATMVWWLANPGIQAWWAAKPTPFSSSFEAFADEVIRSQAFDPDTARRWERFVAGGDSVAAREALGSAGGA